MNLATLVSSLVLAASTATAGLLVAPDSLPLPPLPAAPQDGESGPSVQVGPLCLGVCGNGTSDGNETAPPDGNETAPPPKEEPAPEPAPEARTCGVDIDDSQQFVTGPQHGAWSWQVGAGTQNLSVEVEAQGAWTPFGGGLRIVLTDGDGEVVADSATGGMSLPFDYTAISYQGDASTGLSRGLWHLTIDADGALGSSWVQVHSSC